MSHHGANPSIEDLEKFYQEKEQLWSGNPNSTLVAVVGSAGLTPRRALEIGAGEGADALWLHEQGWQVTAIEPAPTAARRTAQRVPQAVVKAERLENFVAAEPDPFDLVCCSYGQLPATQGTLEDFERVLRPGGTLFILHHDMQGEEADGVAMPAWLESSLVSRGWTVLESGDAVRDVHTGAGAHHHADIFVLLRRPAN